MNPRALLINPWIYDFAAFDLWAKPMGLLLISSWLKKIGFDTRLVDCLDRLHPRSGAPAPKARNAPGTGPWARTPLPTPAPFEGIPRRFCRYGLPEEEFLREVSASPEPDLILIGSMMTYWYPGARRAAALARKAWPRKPLALGGIYPSLCPDHAGRTPDVDFVVSGPAEFSLPAVLEQALGRAGEPLAPPLEFLSQGLRPDLDLYPKIDFAPLMTSRGCPQGCPYCASRRLFPGFVRRPPEDVLDEIGERLTNRGIRHFTLFDDALLLKPEQGIIPLLEGVLQKGLDINFHVPNGLHVGSITPELARLMFRAGFKTIRLGLETLDPDRQAEWGGKVGDGEFFQAMANLVDAGFEPGRIGVYLLYGLPGQPLEEVLKTAAAVKALGGRPYPAEYSPLPQTGLWEQALRASPFDLAGEPLYQNNSIFPCRGKDFSWGKVWDIKRKIRDFSNI
ncbi:MAG: B12-binding domain-containing radical SAM protein [Pseudomonadota bacterium]